MPRRRGVPGLRGLRELLLERGGAGILTPSVRRRRIGRAAPAVALARAVVIVGALAGAACGDPGTGGRPALAWTLAGANAARSAATSEPGPESLPALAWTSPVARGVVSEPVAARLPDGRDAILVGSASEVRALDASTGQPLWTRPVAGAVNASPVLAGDFAWAFTMEGVALRLDPRDGAVVQSIEHDFMLDASPLVAGGTLVFEESALSSAESGGRVIALDAATGGPLWQADVPRSAGRPAACDGERVFVARQDGVTALRLRDGGLAWSHEFPPLVRVYSPIVAAGLVVVAGGSYDPAHVVALDAATGALRWQVRAAARASAAPALSSDEILLPLMDGTIHRHALGDGRALGAIDPGGRSDARPVVGARHVFVPAGHEIVAFERGTWRRAWRFPLPSAEAGGEGVEHLAIAGDALLVARLDGRLDALREAPAR